MRDVPVICVDFDDTLNNLLPDWINYLNNKYGFNVNIEEIKSWEIKKAFPELTEDEVFAPLHDPYFWNIVTEKTDASLYLKKLIDEGFDVYICTSTYHTIAGFKFENCLFRLFPFFDRHKIIITYNKQLINCDILIDDGTHNIVGPYFGLLVDMPHNRDFEVDNKHTYRIYSWEEAYNQVHRLCDGEAEYYEI